MRTFVALELPDELRGEVAALSRTLARGCRGRYVRYESLHLTLAFLGELGEAQARRAVAALDVACEGRGPVALRPDGLGSFGRPADATLWLGMRATDELVGLARDVREALADQGLSFDGHPFVPHVTLARHVRIPRGGLPPLPFPEPCRATRVTLFRSILDPDGARYKPLHTRELA